MDDTIPTRMTVEQADDIAAAILREATPDTLAGRIVIELLRAEVGGHRTGREEADRQWSKLVERNAWAADRERRNRR